MNNADSQTQMTGPYRGDMTNKTLGAPNFTLTPSNDSLRYIKERQIRLFSPNATDGFSVFSQAKRGSSVVYNVR
jgi:hypothetical protein